WFCFFFQAEDGIRDFHVTGVQTCALPIYQAIEGERNCFQCKDRKNKKRKLKDAAGDCRDCKNKATEGKKLCQSCISKRDELSKIDRKSVVVGKECRAEGTQKREEEKIGEE